MNKKFTFGIITMIITILLTSCIKINDVNSNDKIQIWSYFEHNDIHTDGILKIIESSKKFCEDNAIPLEVFTYSSEDISLEDYILKRNVAAATNGNMIIIDDISHMKDIEKQYADYTKLSNYENLLDIYKDEFCIPLGTNNGIQSIDNEILKFYNLSVKKQLITYREYLDIKQEIKKRGAKFELNRSEFFEIINNYLYNNELLFLNEKSEIIKNKNKFEKMLKKTVLDICDDLLLYYNKTNLEPINDISYISVIKDTNSNISWDRSFIYNFIFPRESINSPVADKTYYFSPQILSFSPDFFMYKKISNNKIYDLANYIVSEETYLMLTEKRHLEYAPVFKIEKAKEFLNLNDKNEYIGDADISKKMREIMNIRYDMLLNDKVASKELKNIYFHDKGYKYVISSFIIDLVNDIARELSGDKLSLENFDSNDKKINELIDKKTDEFVVNFNIHYN